MVQTWAAGQSQAAAPSCISRPNSPTKPSHLQPGAGVVGYQVNPLLGRPALYIR